MVVIRRVKPGEAKKLQDLNDEVFADNSAYDPDAVIGWAQTDVGFPQVLFLVPDQARKQQIEAVIHRQPHNAQRLFRVELQEDAYQVLVGWVNT